MGRVRATGDTFGSSRWGAGNRNMFSAGAVNTFFVVLAGDSDVAIFLTFVATERFSEVFAHRDDVATDVDPLTYEPIGYFR